MAKAIITVRGCLDPEVTTLQSTNAKRLKEFVELCAEEAKATTTEFGIADGNISFTVEPDNLADALKSALAGGLGYEVGIVDRKQFLIDSLKKSDQTKVSK